MAGPWDKYANATQPWMRYQPRQATLRADNPTMSERIPIAVKSGLRALGLNKFAANTFGAPIADVLGYSPVGAVAQSWDAGQAAARVPTAAGKVAGLGGGMALAALGAVPGGKALAPTVERIGERMFIAKLGGKEIGQVSLSPRGPFVAGAEFLPEFQGKGIGSAVYNQIEALTGKKLVPSPLGLTPQATSFWQKRLAAMTPSEHAAALEQSKALGAGYGLPEADTARRLDPLARKGEALAMDEASRMARAAEQGFDTDIYHGTGSDIAEFNVGRRGLWATDRPEIADIYANASDSAAGGRDIRAQVANAGPNVMPLKLRGKVLEVSDQGPTGGGWSTDNIASALGVEMGSAGPRLPRLMQEAKDRGYSAVKITDMSDLGGQQTQWSILDPTQVRSKFAAFDPAKRGSSNLLAGLGAGAVAVPTIYQMLGVPDPDAKTQY